MKVHFCFTQHRLNGFQQACHSVFPENWELHLILVKQEQADWFVVELTDFSTMDSSQNPTHSSHYTLIHLQPLKIPLKSMRHMYSIYSICCLLLKSAPVDVEHSQNARNLFVEPGIVCNYIRTNAAKHDLVGVI